MWQVPSRYNPFSYERLYPANYSYRDPENFTANRRGVITLEQRKADQWVRPSFYELAGNFFPLWGGGLGLLLFCGAIASAIGLASRVSGVRRQMAEDLAMGQVVGAEGRVVPARRGYMAQITGRDLRGVYGSINIELAPGAYRFYILPLSGIVLSVEAAPDSAEAPASALFAALASAHDFTTNDLTQNRGGRLTWRQASRFLGRQAFFFVVSAATVVTFFFAVPLAWEHGLEALPTLIGRGRLDLLVPSPLVAILFLIGSLLGLYLVVRLLASAWETVEGVVEREVNLGPGYDVVYSDRGLLPFYHRVGTQRLRVGVRAIMALVPGVAYRLYYTRRGMRVASIEPLSAPR